MNLTKALKLAVGLAFGMMFGVALANAGTVSYTCDPSIAVATCTYLNTTVAGNYSSTFTNANANIYITYGTTGLAQSEQYLNFFTYDQYVAALTSNPDQSPVQVSALAALNTYDATPYHSGNVNLTVALGTALGLTSGLTGITASGEACTPGTSGCYNAIVTVTNDPGTPLYYDTGSEPADAYDFYGVVEHETDEVLGTSSCVGTAAINPSDINPSGNDARSNGKSLAVKTLRKLSRFANLIPSGLADGCGGSTPSAVDLFRYSGPGALILDSSLSTTPGAYFSYDGGTTNGANGVANTPKVYNTLANGDDYADFVSSSPDCGTDIAVQDAEGCPGEDAGLTILNDGRGEINILNAVGYDLVAATQQFQLTTSANPSIGGTVTPASGNLYNQDTVVPLKATPAAGYSFVNWTSSPDAVANPNAASTTIKMSAAETVTANFAAVAGGVTVSPTDIDYGNVIVGHSKKKVVVVQNGTSGYLYVGPISLTITQGDESQFQFEHECPARIKAGTHCSIAVIFTSDAVGPDAGTLNIVTSASGSPIEVPISGAGIKKGH